jgi:hypothetical protein
MRMSSMPTPVATAGRDTSARTDTASQSIIVDPECRKREVVVNSDLSIGTASLDLNQDLLAPAGRSRYDRSSMIPEASIPAAAPAKAPVAVARPFAIIAPKPR